MNMRKRITVLLTVRDPNPPEVLRRALVRLTAEHLRHWARQREAKRP